MEKSIIFITEKPTPLVLNNENYQYSDKSVKKESESAQTMVWIWEGQKRGRKDYLVQEGTLVLWRKTNGPFTFIGVITEKLLMKKGEDKVPNTYRLEMKRAKHPVKFLTIDGKGWYDNKKTKTGRFKRAALEQMGLGLDGSPYTGIKLLKVDKLDTFNRMMERAKM
jgi:hypothetical protein